MSSPTNRTNGRKTVDIYKVQGYWSNAAHYFLTPAGAAAKVIALQEKNDRGLLNLKALTDVIGKLTLNKSKEFLKQHVTKRRAS